MKSPWQQRFFGWYVIALAAGLVLLWVIFEIRKIDAEMRIAEKQARQFAEESDPLLQMPEAYGELVVRLAEALPRMKAAVEVYGATHQESALALFRRESDALEELLERLIGPAQRAHVIVKQPIQLDVSPGAVLSEVRTVYRAYAESVTGFASDVVTATRPYRELESYQLVNQRYRELEQAAEKIKLHQAFVKSSLYAAGGWFEQTKRLTETWREKFSRLMVVLAVTALVAFAALTHLGYSSLIRSLKRQVVESRSQASMARFGRLATTLAHEIRNPLTAINVRLFTLQRGLKAGSTEHEDATIIRREIDRLNRYLKEFLQFARPSESSFAPLTAEPLLNEVRALLAAELAEREIELRVVIEQDGSFRGEADKLKQVLINLVKNGAESIGQRGRMILRASRTTHPFDGQPAAAMLIEVTDNGPGIAPEIADQVFAPFYSTKKSGTGLGLPTAAQIVTEHGGRLEFRSPPAGETTFCIWLPLTER